MPWHGIHAPRIRCCPYHGAPCVPTRGSESWPSCIRLVCDSWETRSRVRPCTCATLATEPRPVWIAKRCAARASSFALPVSATRHFQNQTLTTRPSAVPPCGQRSKTEERRDGKGCGSKSRSRWARYNKKKKKQKDRNHIK